MSLNHIVGGPASATTAATATASAGFPHTYQPIRLNSVTQLTSTATAVTLNSRSGIIHTFATTIAGPGSAAFTLNNSQLAVGSLMRAWIAGGAFAAGSAPTASVSTIAAGSAVITVGNASGTATGANSITVAYEIIG